MDQQATRPKPRSYTEDYKRQVVDLVVSSGRTSTAGAGEVGLHPTLLCRWVRQYGASGITAEGPRPAAVSSLRGRPNIRAVSRKVAEGAGHQTLRNESWDASACCPGISSGKRVFMSR